MAPLKNVRSKDNIMRAAFSLFMRKGFSQTSYTDIANESGYGRPLIQYYYPKKTNFISDFLHQLFRLTAQYTEKELYLDQSKISSIIINTQIYYSFLLKDKEARNLTQEMLNQRTVTNEVIGISSKAACEALGLTNAEDINRFRESFLVATGGTYDMLYSKLYKDEKIDPTYLAHKNMRTIMILAFDFSEQKILTLLQENTLSSTVVDRAISELTLQLIQ